MAQIHLCLNFYGEEKPAARGQIAALRKVLREHTCSLRIFETDPERAFAILSKTRDPKLPAEEPLRTLLRDERKQQLLIEREFELKREAHLRSYANIERRFLGHHRITDQTRQKIDEKVVGTTMSCVVDLANIF